MKTISRIGFALAIGSFFISWATSSICSTVRPEVSSTSINVLHVKPTGSDDNDGLTWDSAKRTVQASIDGSSAGTEIWVAKGTYAERVILTNAIALYGGFAGTETLREERNTALNETILYGEEKGYAVEIEYTNSRTTRVDGFTICHGGYGIRCFWSSATISNNLITGNFGSGIRCYEGGYDGSPTIVNNKIFGNGGGIWCDECYKVTITNNVITGNSGPRFGGGIFCYMSITDISNNIIVGNSSTEEGGGVAYSGYSGPFFNNIVAFNSKGGIWADQRPDLSNNCVFGNSFYDYKGVSAGIGDISVDPLMEDWAGGNYHLKPNSPCINAGSNAGISVFAADMDGQSRILGGTADIGADEYMPSGDLVTICGAKRAAENSWVEFTGDAVTARFGNAFYLENDKRSSGIRVEKLGHTLDRPMQAHVFGKVKTNADGEVYVDASTAEQHGSESKVICALSMSNCSLGGGAFGLQEGLSFSSGLSNIGLLVKTWGKVVERDAANPATWFKIDDGSGKSVKCILPAGVTIDPLAKYVSVTGISSCEKIDSKLCSLLRVRIPSEILSF